MPAAAKAKLAAPVMTAPRTAIERPGLGPTEFGYTQ
jgi:hypothetical protein